jgi:hypothetical protein
MQNSPKQKVLDGLNEYANLIMSGLEHEEALQELESYTHPIIVAEIERRLEIKRQEAEAKRAPK